MEVNVSKYLVLFLQHATEDFQGDLFIDNMYLYVQLKIKLTCIGDVVSINWKTKISFIRFPLYAYYTIVFNKLQTKRQVKKA